MGGNIKHILLFIPQMILLLPFSSIADLQQHAQEQVSALTAFKVLNKCQTCHTEDPRNTDLAEVAEIDWYNFISDLKFPNRKKWSLKIKSQIKKNKMPPKEATKDFSELELSALIHWIEDGTPNFNGEKPL